MDQRRRCQYFYRCYSESSAGYLKCGNNGIKFPLPEEQLLDEFDRHRNRNNKVPTALVSVSSRPVEALHRAFEKYYNLQESPEQIWIIIIRVPEHGETPRHAQELAKTLEGDKNCGFFKYEYVFEGEIPEQYVEHRVSVRTMLNRGLDLQEYLNAGECLPNLRTLRTEMSRQLLDTSLDAYGSGRALGRMARCFGARAPVYEIALQIVFDCRCSKPFDDPYFYWVTYGLNEELDNWLAYSDFPDNYTAHTDWVISVCEEVQSLWDAGVEMSDDNAREPQIQSINDRIEREAIAIGL